MKSVVVRALMIATIAASTSCSTPATTREAPAPVQPAASPAVTFPDGSKAVIEVVSDEMTRAQGLMFRSSLGGDRGMLFIFPDSAEHSFWMKNTLIPLDIIWIDEAKTIVHVARDVPPCKSDPCPSYPPNAVARYVLELAAGQAAARGLDEGDKLAFEGVENIVAR